MKNLIKALKNSEKIKTIHATSNDKIIMVENELGTITVINAKQVSSNEGGYQWNLPIKPNLITGSAIGGTEGYFDYISFEKMVEIAGIGEKFIPNFYSDKEIETIKFETADEHLKSSIIYKKKIK